MSDTRGQIGSSAIANFLLALVVGAALTWIVSTIATPLLGIQPASGPVASQSTDWLQIAITNQPLMFLFFSFFSLLAQGVVEREVLGV